MGGGVVLAASYEAKACGVRTAMGGAQARAAVPAGRRRRAALLGLRRGQQGGVRDLRGHHAAGRGAVDRRGVPRRARAGPDLGHARRDRRPAAPRGARAGRAAHHRRRGADEVPGQGGQRGGQARRAARRAARRRARRSCTRCRSSGCGASGRSRREKLRGGASPPSAGGAAGRGRAHGHRRPGRRAATCTRWPTTAIRGGCDGGRRRRSIGAQHALGRGAALAGPSSTRCSSALVDRVDPAAARRRDRVCRTVVLRLRFGDFTRATRSHTLAEATARDARRPRHRAGPAGGGRCPDRARGHHAGRRAADQPATTTAPSSSRCPSTRSGPAPSTRALDDVRDRFGSAAIHAGGAARAARADVGAAAARLRGGPRGGQRRREPPPLPLFLLLPNFRNSNSAPPISANRARKGSVRMSRMSPRIIWSTLAIALSTPGRVPAPAGPDTGAYFFGVVSLNDLVWLGPPPLGAALTSMITPPRWRTVRAPLPPKMTSTFFGPAWRVVKRSVATFFSAWRWVATAVALILPLHGPVQLTVTLADLAFLVSLPPTRWSGFFFSGLGSSAWSSVSLPSPSVRRMVALPIQCREHESWKAIMSGHGSAMSNFFVAPPLAPSCETGKDHSTLSGCPPSWSSPVKDE